MSDALCTQGKALLSAGKTSDARDLYISAVHRDDDNAHAWNGLGVADDLMGKRDAALEAYKHAVDLTPEDLVAVNNLAHLYVENGDPESAVALLEPHAGDPSASATLRQNLATAHKAILVKEEAGGDIYADIGSYPTDGMAQGHIREAQHLLGSDAKNLNFSIIPEVKTGGGVPTFTVKITGASPQDICDALNHQAIPCIPHGK